MEMEREKWRCSSSSGSCSCGKMIEQASEELEKLETQHPCRFGLLKMEVQSFILHLQSDHFLLHVLPSLSSPSSFVTTSTQESAYMKRKEEEGLSNPTLQEMVDATRSVESHQRCGRHMHLYNNTKRTRVDMVLDRAKSCLKKLQQLKSSI